MPCHVLGYHDVVGSTRHDASGFPGPTAASYKLAPDVFEAHLAAIAANVTTRPAIGEDFLGGLPPPGAWALTFDDGGVGAHDHVAGRLEAHGWRGLFFVPTDFVDRPGFLTREQVVDLRRRGHTIGSHTCSHPTPMGAQNLDALRREWRESVRVLSSWLGEPVATASVPGGDLTSDVARAAYEAGIRVLFTSDPSRRIRARHGCLLVGRFGVRRTTPPSFAARLARGDPWAGRGQAVLWGAKKLAKRLGGRYYLELRRRLFN